MNVLNDLVPLLPVGVVALAALLVLMWEVFSEQTPRRVFAHFTWIALFVALLFTGLDILTEGRSIFPLQDGATSLRVDAFTRFAWALLLGAGIVSTFLSPGYTKSAGCESGEYYGLLLFSIVGMMIMVAAQDLISLFLGLETMSIAVYSLTGLKQGDRRGPEAALKYFLTGAFATGFLVFGIALIYGILGTVHFSTIFEKATNVSEFSPLLVLGFLFVMGAFLFKVSAVPFHMWAPDAYEGAPTPVAGFMAVGVKAAAFIAFIKFVVLSFPQTELSSEWISLTRWFAIVTILVGNVLAITQSNVKRMLAYSSISHAGYVLAGVVAAMKGETSAVPSILFYLLNYTFMTLGAFGVVSYLEQAGGGPGREKFHAFNGLGYRFPAISAAMVVFMVALGGIPPTGGFFAKLYVFSSILRAGETTLVVLAILGSVVSLYYYLRVLVSLYMKEGDDSFQYEKRMGRGLELGLGVVLSLVCVLGLGLLPSVFLDYGRIAANALSSVRLHPF